MEFKGTYSNELIGLSLSLKKETATNLFKGEISYNLNGENIIEEILGTTNFSTSYYPYPQDLATISFNSVNGEKYFIHGSLSGQAAKGSPITGFGGTITIKKGSQNATITLTLKKQ